VYMHVYVVLIALCAHVPHRPTHLQEAERRRQEAERKEKGEADICYRH